MRLLQTLGIVVFIGCLLAGIGYTLVVLEWSGKPVATIAHPAREGTFTAPLDLAPAMNPLRAGFDTRFSQTLGSATLDATVTLRAPDGATAWTRHLRVTDSDGGGIGGSTSVSLPVERFDVAEAGRYAMEIALDDDVGAHFITAEVDVRRNVRALDWTLLLSLGVAGAGGLALAIGAGVMRDRLPDRTR